MCQNSPFYEVTLATDNCSEGDFLFIRVLTQPLSFFTLSPILIGLFTLLVLPIL